MIVRPSKEHAKLGAKCFDTKDPSAAFAGYRARFAPLADTIELICEDNDGNQFGSGDSGVVAANSEPEATGARGKGIDGDTAD